MGIELILWIQRFGIVFVRCISHIGVVYANGFQIGNVRRFEIELDADQIAHVVDGVVDLIGLS